MNVDLDYVQRRPFDQNTLRILVKRIIPETRDSMPWRSIEQVRQYSLESRDAW